MDGILSLVTSASYWKRCHSSSGTATDCGLGSIRPQRCDASRRREFPLLLCKARHDDGLQRLAGLSRQNLVGVRCGRGGAGLRRKRQILREQRADRPRFWLSAPRHRPCEMANRSDGVQLPLREVRPHYRRRAEEGRAVGCPSCSQRHYRLHAHPDERKTLNPNHTVCNLWLERFRQSGHGNIMHLS
jgi:hypothetical protein